MARWQGVLLGGFVTYDVVLGGPAGFSTIRVNRGPRLGGRTPEPKGRAGGDAPPK